MVSMDPLSRYDPLLSADQSSVAGSPRHNVEQGNDVEELSELEKNIKKAEEIR